MSPLNHLASFSVKNVMEKAHIIEKVTALPEHLFTWFRAHSFPPQYRLNCYLLSAGLMWQMKDDGISSRPQCSDFSGYLSETDAMI